MKPRISHARLEDSPQSVWIIFGGRADQPWLYPLRRGFRHCFAAIGDAEGWTVLDPLSGRLLVARLPVDAGFDLPGFYRRAGLRVTGPHTPGPAAPAAAHLRAKLRGALPCPSGRRCAARRDPFRALSQVAKWHRKFFRKNVLTRVWL